ncbi:DUF1127 domain-containing protein [Rhizobium sp. ICMP 5592]|uniref:DUF1127 domain-containing protein n=1 Tax=Rhizobium sp. ICMP 5592 TaxID=2292445 RepID=UPI001295350A|nr:DUF1127 domain-containing protein [Rhizobium sp. ICMP 5592]MQB44071.1 DUF1127 domain-containing protein [Rhizobium sp. ICMP 5592]
MSTTDRTLHLGHAEPSLPLTARLTLAFEKMAKVWRTFRNRREINYLHELNDSQLMDIGLTRQELRSALTTSTFFEDPSCQLSNSARHRARLFGLDSIRR